MTEFLLAVTAAPTGQKGGEVDIVSSLGYRCKEAGKLALSQWLPLLRIGSS